jgi:hypothetical protein
MLQKCIRRKHSYNLVRTIMAAPPVMLIKANGKIIYTGSFEKEKIE